MKKINIFMASILAGASMVMTSCKDDFLDQKPKGQYSVETYYASDEALEKTTEPIFGRAWHDFNNRAFYLIGSFRANDAYNAYKYSEFGKFQVTSSSQEIADAWRSLYNVISLSNATMKSIELYSAPEVSEAAKDHAIGECHLLRGWAYFYLLRGWGDVIINDDNETLLNNPVRQRCDEASVLEFIIRDFEAADSLLPEKTNNYHPTRYAAKAALAKALLAQSGWVEYSKDDQSTELDHNRDEATLARVVKLCDEVINKGPYKLLPDYADLFKPENNDNAETILAMQWAKPSTNDLGSLNSNYSDLAWSEVTDVNTQGKYLTITPDMLDMYNYRKSEDKNDRNKEIDTVRLNATFFNPNQHYSEIRKSEGGYTYRHNWMHVKKGIVGTTQDVKGELKENASPLYTYIQRLADVYLMKAEALLGNNDSTKNPEALAAFNAVRNRAKVLPYTVFDFNDLIRERRIEFCMEYSNWFDMVTWYRWRPQTMLNYFNNVQMRGCIINEGDIIKNTDDGTFSYRCIPLGQNTSYIFDGVHLCWNDFQTVSANDDRHYQGRGTAMKNWKLDFYAQAQQCYDGKEGRGLFTPVVLSEANIMLPYPENDVLQNPFLDRKEKTMTYKFNKK